MGPWSTRPPGPACTRGPGRGFRSACVSRSTSRDTSAGAAHVGRAPDGRLRSFHRRRRRARRTPMPPWSLVAVQRPVQRDQCVRRIGISLDGRSRGAAVASRSADAGAWTPALRDAPGRRGPGARPPRPRRDRSARSCVRDHSALAVPRATGPDGASLGARRARGGARRVTIARPDGGGGARGGPSRFRRPRLILKRKGALVMGIRGLCSVFTHSQAFRHSARSKLTTYLVKASFPHAP